MSLFGVQELANILLPRHSDQTNGKATEAIGSIVLATEDQFDDAIKVTFRAGDQLQRGLVDLMYNILALEAFTPRSMTRMAFDMVRQSAEAFKLLMPGQDSRVAWMEFGNKLQAFDLFEHVDSTLRLRPCSAVPLTDLIEKASALGSYFAVWATEGLGHYYAERFWEQTGTARNLLTGDGASAVPEKSLAPLHAGMGLSFANRLLEQITPQSHPGYIQEVLRQFVMLCDTNSRNGYQGAAYESLGLVARNLYPQMVQTIDEQLSEIDSGLVGYFWHGVGRAIYFAPTNFLPGAISRFRGVEMTRQESPHELARLNTLAGLIWALTLVNIRQPEIMQSLLKHHGDRLSESDAFSNGLSSSIIIWRDATQNDDYIARLCQYQPSDPTLGELWDSLIKRPCENALQNYYGVLKKHNFIGEVFRYQSLPELVARLSD